MRRHRLAFLMLSAALLATASAASQPDPDESRWRTVLTSDEVMIHLDIETVRSTGQMGVYRGWFRWVYFEREYDQGVGYFDKQRILQLFDCPANRYALLQLVFYRGADVVDSTVNPYPDWSYVPPGSVGERYLRASCDLLDGR